MDESSRSHAAAFRALLLQLIQSHRREHTTIDALALFHEEYARNHAQASEEDLKELLKILLSQFPAFIVIDGVEEAHEPAQFLNRLLDTLDDLDSKAILLTRPTVPIPATWTGASRETSCAVALTSDDNHTDFEVYFSTGLSRMVSDGLFGQASYHEISCHIQMLVHRANGMFLWADLLMRHLRSDGLSPRKRLIVLENANLLQGLDGLYSGILALLEAGFDENQTMASSILYWVACALYPLAVTTLRIAVAIEPGQLTEESQQLCSWPECIPRITGALVEVFRGRAVFVHSSLQEFLQSAKSTRFKRFSMYDLGPIHAYLATQCLSYLAHDVPQEPIHSHNITTNAGHLDDSKSIARQSSYSASPLVQRPAYEEPPWALPAEQPTPHRALRVSRAPSRSAGDSFPADSDLTAAGVDAKRLPIALKHMGLPNQPDEEATDSDQITVPQSRFLREKSVERPEFGLKGPSTLTGDQIQYCTRKRLKTNYQFVPRHPRKERDHRKEQIGSRFVSISVPLPHETTISHSMMPVALANERVTQPPASLTGSLLPSAYPGDYSETPQRTTPATTTLQPPHEQQIPAEKDAAQQAPATESERANMKELPFLSYAALSWVQHIRKSIEEQRRSDVRAGMEYTRESWRPESQRTEAFQLRQLLASWLPVLSQFLLQSGARTVWAETCFSYKLIPDISWLLPKLIFLRDRAGFHNTEEREIRWVYHGLHQLSEALKDLRRKSILRDTLMSNPSCIWGRELQDATDTEYWPVWEGKKRSAAQDSQLLFPESREPYEPGASTEFPTQSRDIGQPLFPAS